MLKVKAYTGRLVVLKYLSGILEMTTLCFVMCVYYLCSWSARGVWFCVCLFV